MEPWWSPGVEVRGKEQPGLLLQAGLTSVLGWAATGLGWHSAGVCEGTMVRAWPQLPFPIPCRGHQTQGQCGQ